MTASMQPRRRGFPDVSWGWPPQSHHLLLCAATSPDTSTALAALGEWLRLHDLNDARFSEHRLLAAVAGRHGDGLKHLPEYPRLVGIQRLNWTLSRMAVAEIRPALMSLADAGVQIILIKGAARVALDPSEQKVRTSWDVDVLLSDDDFAKSFKLLSDQGWRSARGESVLALAGRLQDLRARNLKKGRFGDIDLHKQAYKAENASDSDDTQLVRAARTAVYYDVPCLVPSAEERLAMAVAHGGLDGESHSDWIVDCIRITQQEAIDWSALEALLARRNLLGHAEVAFSYIRHGLGLGELFADRFPCGRDPGRISLRHLPSLLLSKHPSAMSGPLKLLRRIIVETRKSKDARGQRPADQPLFIAPLFRQSAQPGPLDTTAAIDGSAVQRAGDYDLRLELHLTTTSTRRRADFELVSGSRCICQLRALSIRGVAGGRRVTFKGKVRLDPAEGDLQLTALPGKYLEDTPSPQDTDRYAPLPFRLATARLTPRGQ